MFRTGTGKRPEIGVVLAQGGQRLFTLEERVFAWDFELGTALFSLPVWADCLAVSHEGRLLATAGTDGIVTIWDAETGVQLAALAGHGGPVANLAFAPDDRTLLSAGSCSFNEWRAEIDIDPTVGIWDV